MQVVIGHRDHAQQHFSGLDQLSFGHGALHMRLIFVFHDSPFFYELANCQASKPALLLP
jgi:hypothetical protein